MPKYRLSVPFSRFHGKIGHLVEDQGLVLYSSDKTGNVARSYVVPDDPESNPQLLFRNLMSSVASSYASLSSEDIAYYDEVCRRFPRTDILSQKYYLSAANIHTARCFFSVLRNAEGFDTPDFPLPPSSVSYTEPDWSVPLPGPPVVYTGHILFPLVVLFPAPLQVSAEGNYSLLCRWFITDRAGRRPRKNDFRFLSYGLSLSDSRSAPYNVEGVGPFDDFPTGYALVFEFDPELFEPSDFAWLDVTALNQQCFPLWSGVLGPAVPGSLD